MIPSLELTQQLNPSADLIVILDSPGNPEIPGHYFHNPADSDYIKAKFEKGKDPVVLHQAHRKVYFVKTDESKQEYQAREALRKKGHRVFNLLKEEQTTEVELISTAETTEHLLALAEGLLLSSYQFNKYKSHSKQETGLQRILFQQGQISQEELSELTHIIRGTFAARDLVNEPPNVLTSVELSERFRALGKEAGFNVEIFDRKRIEELKMGGLLAVNQASTVPPTFTIMEYRPENARNEQPYVLVGKGVVYDTGGLSIKPTPNSMDYMKSDMAGAAAVAGAMYTIAANKLPVHVIGIVPATDNNIGANGFMPGDVITMFTGKTVEIRNTDAEGRLILGDALGYASRYKPQLVIDVATLTGSAARAIGSEGIVYMGTAPEEVKTRFEQAGLDVYERLVEFPLWDEYDEQIKSDIADIKNLGGESAGMITAGKFLQHFTDYDWLHLDIAGVAYLFSLDSYRGKHATGVCVRLLYRFLKEGH